MMVSPLGKVRITGAGKAPDAGRAGDGRKGLAELAAVEVGINNCYF